MAIDQLGANARTPLWSAQLLVGGSVKWAETWLKIAPRGGSCAVHVVRAKAAGTLGPPSWPTPLPQEEVAAAAAAGRNLSGDFYQQLRLLTPLPKTRPEENGRKKPLKELPPDVSSAAPSAAPVPATPAVAQLDSPSSQSDVMVAFEGDEGGRLASRLRSRLRTRLWSRIGGANRGGRLEEDFSSRVTTLTRQFT
eukprot:SAG11_NODE_2024_length_3908_cov_4.691783_2_plen_195_part_00